MYRLIRRTACRYKEMSKVLFQFDGKLSNSSFFATCNDNKTGR